MDMVRGLRSPMLYLTALAVAILQWAGVWQEMALDPRADVFSLYCIQGMETTAISLAALPFATAFCVEWRHRYARYAIQRSSIGAYSWSKLLTASALGGAAVALGYAAFYGALALRLPLADAGSSAYAAFSQRAPFGRLLRDGRRVAFFAALFLLDHALVAAIGAAVAVAVSGAMPNLFVALSAPIVYSYINVNAFSSNKYLSLIAVFDGLRGESFGGALPTLAYRLGYAAATVALLGSLFRVLVQRRVVVDG